MNLNKFGKRAYKSALKRGKITDTEDKELIRKETLTSLQEEVGEVLTASEDFSSEHIPSETEMVEELIDVAIVVFTELHRRGVDIEETLHKKMKYNENRED